MKIFKRFIKKEDGFSFISATVILLIVVMCMVFALRFLPVFIQKATLDRQANELMRVAEISGNVGGSATTAFEKTIDESNDYILDIKWSKTGKIPIGETFQLQISMTMDIGFGNFGTVPVNLISTATGVSEVFQK